MKKAILFCALTALFLTANPARAETCFVKLNDGWGEWKGPCKDGKAYGTGVAYFPNLTYEGPAQDGLAQGQGELRFKKGGVVRGNFHRGAAQGQFEGTGAEGDRIVGEFRLGEDGKRHLSYSGADRHVDQKLNAQDAARAAPAARECRLEIGDGYLDWSGQCKDGKAHGNGQAVAPDGITYAGSAEEGKPHGHGTVTSASGQMLYQGGYRDGVPHGRGTFLDDDDKYYVADFENGWQVSEEIPTHGFASEESPPENAGDTDILAGGAALPGLDEGGNQEDEDGYEAAVNALDGGGGVVRAGIPDDDYDAKLTELDRREALEIEARFREKQLEAESRSEAIKAEIRKEEAAKDAKKRRGRAALDQKVKKYWERELGSSGTKRSRRRTPSDNFGGFGKALERLHKTIKEREKLERHLERNRQAVRKKRKARKRERELKRKRKLEQLRRKQLEWQRTVERLRQEEFARQQRRAEQQRREQLERQRREQQKERERRERLARLARERDRKIANLRKALNRALARCNRLKRGRSGCRNGQIRFYNGEIRSARRHYEILVRPLRAP